MANISKIKVGNTSYGITATPTAHASTATTYGAASASNYGHVKLSDNYTSSAGTAASGIGASSAAVYNAYNTLNSNLNIFPDYANCVQLLNHDVIPNDTTYNYTVTETAYYYAMAYTNTESAEPYVRITCGEYNWAFPSPTGYYKHVTSPPLLFKKGTVIQIVVVGQKRLFFKVPICTEVWKK